jgi:hypothetical protein
MLLRSDGKTGGWIQNARAEANVGTALVIEGDPMLENAG